MTAAAPPGTTPPRSALAGVPAPLAPAASPRARRAWLALLSAAFLARVLGQLVALLASPRRLPPFDAWHSGLLPYPLLLAAQIAILALMARVLRDVARGGPRARPGPRLARALRRAAPLYAAAMLLRYPLTMALSPESRWTGGAIPIAFHLVLAAWLWTFARAESEARPRLIRARPRPWSRARRPRARPRARAR